MTGRRPARLLCGLAVALLLTACGGGGVTTAADDAAASAAGHVSGAATPGRGSGEQQVAPTTPATTGRGSSGDGARGNPGAPLGDPAAGGGDTQAQGNPGAPGDVAVFEEAGVPYSVLKDDANSTCAGGVCTLLAPVVGAGKPDDVGGVDQCVVRKQSDIRYDPPAQGGFFRRGAKVQATVDCAVHDSGGETTSGTTTSGTTTSGTDTSGGTQTSGGTSGSSAPGQAPAGRPQG